MEFAYVKGEAVVVRDTLSQVFVGEVKTINEKLGRIVLKDLIQLPERIAISGYRNFDRDEIVEIRRASLEEINGDAVESSANDVKADTEPAVVKSSDIQELEVKKVNYTFVKDLSSDFYSAISALQNFPKIGLVAQDTSKGRHKRASVVAASTPTDVFIFDVLLLGDELFLQGLGEILQSPRIEKIVHDSRFLSDCLKRKHAVNLENVRDVEAEDIMVVHQERETVRRHRRTLEYLIGVYLRVEVEGLSNKGWEDRPLREDLLQGLAEIISYLIPLHETIERKYLKRLIDASRVYSSHVRDMDLFDYLHYDHEKTLRKEMIEIVTPKGDIRGDGRPKMTS